MSKSKSEEARERADQLEASVERAWPDASDQHPAVAKRMERVLILRMLADIHEGVARE